MISELAKPSNTKTKIHLRGATVKQAMAFSDVLESHSERITTEFLNAVQLPEFFTDSNEWTEGDRVTALFWYHIHTVKDSFVSIDYECPHCKKPHSHYFDSRVLGESFQNLQGKPYREYEILGRHITFTPLTGRSLTAIQATKRELEGGLTSDELANELALERLVHSFRLTHAESKTVSELREWVLGLQLPEYWELMAAFNEAQESMKHGIEYRHFDGDTCFVLPPHECINKHELADEDKEGAATKLLWPFLSSDFIPKLQPR